MTPRHCRAGPGRSPASVDVRGRSGCGRTRSGSGRGGTPRPGHDSPPRANMLGSSTAAIEAMPSPRRWPISSSNSMAPASPAAAAASTILPVNLSGSPSHRATRCGDWAEPEDTSSRLTLQRRARGVRLPTAAVAAPAPHSVLDEADVAELATDAEAAVQHPAVDDGAAADAGAHGDEDEVVHVAAGAEQELPTPPRWRRSRESSAGRRGPGPACGTACRATRDSGRSRPSNRCCR